MKSSIRVRNVLVILALFAVPLAAMFLSGIFPGAGQAMPSVWAAENEDVPLTPQNDIPLVIVRIDEPDEKYEEDGNWYGTVADMNGSKDHSVRCKGTVEIVMPEGYESHYGGGVPAGQMDLSYIRGRGNSTWMSEKKPYKFKIKNAPKEGEDTTGQNIRGPQDLFGMGASQEWALMANANDPTLIKNKITSWLGEQIGMEYTPQMVPVDVVMIGSETGGEYIGSYFLSELVMAEANRLDIDPPGKNVESGDDLTGGYLITYYQEFQNHDEPDSTVFETKAGIALINDTPSYDDTSKPLTAGQEAQRTYIRNYIQDVEDLIMDSETIDAETHEEIASKLDLQSVADYWLIQEFCKNGDAFGTDSTKIYKEKNGKLCFGPLWDFDISWGSQGDGWTSEDTNDVTGFNNTQMPWVEALRDKDPAFESLLQERWAVLDEKFTELTQDQGVIDQFAAELRQSQDADVSRWDDAEEGVPYTGAQDYDDVIGQLKDYIKRRQAWIKENIDNVGKVTAKVTCIADGKPVGDPINVRCGMSVYDDNLPEAPKKQGHIFVGWYEQETGEKSDGFRIEKDTVFIAQYIREEDAVQPKGLYFTTYEYWQSFEGEMAAIMEYVVDPEDATDKSVTWTVSDPEIATLGYGESLDLHKTGTVTVTGTLANGVSNSYVMHVYDPDDAEVFRPDGIKADEKEMTLHTGQTEQIPWHTTPEEKKTSFLPVEFESSDETVVSVENHTGVIKGLKPGTATITINAMINDGESEDWVPVSDTVTVTVTDPPSYSYEKGDEVVTWTKGSKEGLQFTFHRTPDDEHAIDHFTGIEIDGKAMDQNSYEKKSGSVVVTLKADYLETLATGDHTLTALFDDAAGPSAAFKVAEASEDSQNSAAGEKASGTDGKSSTAAKTSTGSKSGTSKNAASAKTGDEDNMARWLMALIASGAVLVLITGRAHSRRRKGL